MPSRRQNPGTTAAPASPRSARPDVGLGPADDASPGARSHIDFDIWGCRGSRNILPRRSRIGNHTSCYSLLQGRRLLVFDAGLGLVMLSHATLNPGRFRGVEEVHVLVTHAHVDHWEGLKDAEWFWVRDNGITVTVAGPAEALRSIEGGFAHPSYVPLATLALGTAASVSLRSLEPDRPFTFGDWEISPLNLNHYSGAGATRKEVHTLGYRVMTGGGPTLAYLCDHEPTDDTVALEEQATRDAHLIVYDAHFLNRHEHTFGHGSIEYAAAAARRQPEALVLAGHLSARYTDAQLRESFLSHGARQDNFRLAKEGQTYRWSPPHRRFAARRSG